MNEETAYQLGRLTGYACIASVSVGLLIGAAFLIARSKGAAGKIGGVVLAFGGVCVLGALAVAGVDGGRGAAASADSLAVAEFERAYRENCVSQCVAAGADAAQCTPPCECTLQRLYAAGPREQVVRSLTRRIENGAPTAELRAEIEAHSLECVADQYDANFLEGCRGNLPAGRTPEQHAAHCTCVLASLRAGMSRGEGTRWLIENLEVEPMTEVGRAGVERASVACPLE